MSLIYEICVNYHVGKQILCDTKHDQSILRPLNQTECGNRECVNETTTRAKSRKQPKVTNYAFKSGENLAPGGRLQLAL